MHKTKAVSYLPWLWLSLIFLFLAIDETARIHERFGASLGNSFNHSGLLFFAWVVPYGVALVGFVLVYLKFLLNLPRKIMILFVVSATIYVAGALGLELFGGRHHDIYGKEDLVYALLYTCEEFLEMLGIVFFIYTLLLYISCNFRPFTIIVQEQ